MPTPATLPYAGALARKIALFQGYVPHAVALTDSDITKLHLDAIVNAANKSLLGGGGVDGAIHAAANDAQFLEECRRHGGCGTGEAKVTNAYNLPCKSVIHTVGPVYDRHSPSKARSFLQDAYRNSLDAAVQNQLRSIAFPSISTGVYGFPINDAAQAAVEEVHTYLQGPHGDQIDLVVFCCFSAADLRVYENVARQFFAGQ
ncbi:hypothetical protein MSPP1_002188 [Malassezia sp. CBS 17886]|nr:hypothetical protein MSPP1_002188 [Malassezia sp. CBS 17886]